MMKFKHILLAATVIFAAAGCSKEDVDPEFLESEDIALTVNGKAVFTYDDASCQTGYNEARGEFSVFTDKMSDYYVVTLVSVPQDEGETIKGNISWTSEYDVVEKKALSFRVARIESDGRIWLWNSKEKIGAVVMKF